jgi:hypothetical protein
MAGSWIEANKDVELLPSTTITTAVSGLVGPTIIIPGAKYLLIMADFVYGSGGTNAKFWLQTTVDGTTWRDIASFAFLVASARKISALHVWTASAAALAASDGALADDTIANGVLGGSFRVKYTTTGTYAGGTTCRITANAKG